MDKDFETQNETNSDMGSASDVNTGSDADAAASADSSSDLNADSEKNVDTSTEANASATEETGDDLNGAIGNDAPQEETKQPPEKTMRTEESSARSRIITAGADGLQSPSVLAQGVAEARAPAGAEDAYAQGLQATWNMGVQGSNEYMDATIRQHGASPSAELNNMQIQQEINNASDYQGKPLREQSYYDENGAEITDEKLRE